MVAMETNLHNLKGRIKGGEDAMNERIAAPFIPIFYRHVDWQGPFLEPAKIHLASRAAILRDDHFRSGLPEVLLIKSGGTFR